jgi:hypothetical protein
VLVALLFAMSRREVGLWMGVVASLGVATALQVSRAPSSADQLMHMLSIDLLFLAWWQTEAKLSYFVLLHEQC